MLKLKIQFEAHGFYFKFPPKFRNNSEIRMLIEPVHYEFMIHYLRQPYTERGL